MKTMIVFIWLGVILTCVSARSKTLVKLTEDNWLQINKGEWMIEFHAPWCPACKDLEKTWDSFASWSKDLAISVGEIDVTANPGLSGRFLVTALPTIYHVKDGVFRMYQGPRDKEDFMKFIEDKKWTVVEPISQWKNPESIQMSVVAVFFRLSMYVRDLHNYLIEQQGLPPVASYALFGGATLVLGCVLGFFIVCIIDCVFPAGAAPPSKPQQSAKKDAKKVDKPNNATKDKSPSKDSNKKKADEAAARDSQAETGSQYSQSQTESSADENEDDQKLRQRKPDENKSTPAKENNNKANNKSNGQVSPAKSNKKKN